ncbi:MAG: Lrp/AsnC family transcriptional regulator [Thermoplasmata archaeon]|nr:Lrp/AsnC family transcriptional regulator [Thermoplasmata archaeon]
MKAAKKSVEERSVGLDDLDDRLIGELRRDGRTPVSVLARRLGVARVTVQLRLKRLVENKVIRQFTVVVDRKSEGQDLAAFTIVNLVSGSIDQKAVGEAMARIPGVVEVHDVTGRPDFVIKIRGRSLEGIGEWISRVREIPGVASTETLACVITYKEEL